MTIQQDARSADEEAEVIDQQQAELLAYITDVLNTIATGDEEKDQQAIEAVADNVHSKAVNIHEEFVYHL